VIDKARIHTPTRWGGTGNPIRAVAGLDA